MKIFGVRNDEVRKKIAKKVIRDTWASITYYFAKYHVILGQVSLVSKNAIVGLTFGVIIGFVAHG